MNINRNHNYCKLFIEINEFFHTKFKVIQSDQIDSNISNSINRLYEMFEKSLLY